MDLIYIVDKEPETRVYTPNFSIPGQDELNSSKSSTKRTSNLTGVTGTIALSTLSLFTPIPLLIAASIATPKLYKLVTSDNKTEVVPEDSVNELADFIDKHSHTKQQVLSKGFKFPPGHPRIGESYRLHPLAEYPQYSRQNLYIPENIFDDVLFEERESELLTLLVHLGATKVEIAKYVDNFFEGEQSGSIGGGSKIVGEASLSAESNTGRSSNEKSVRTFSLKGKPWEYGNKLEREDFAWLNFEPSWNALIIAREVGGCTSATLEIKEASKYATNKETSMQLKAKIYSANGTLKFMEKDLTETSYIFKVTFS
jgi:hypothetical protein